MEKLLRGSSDTLILYFRKPRAATTATYTRGNSRSTAVFQPKADHRSTRVFNRFQWFSRPSRSLFAINSLLMRSGKTAFTTCDRRGRGLLLCYFSYSSFFTAVAKKRACVIFVYYHLHGRTKKLHKLTCVHRPCR